MVMVEPALVGRYCHGCGAPLSESVRGDALYCSAACRARHWRWTQRTRTRVRTMRGVSAARAVCPVCGQDWIVGIEHRSSAIYCSHRCRTRAWRDKRSPQPSP
ncbi:hypothetical protein ABW05_01845 [Mycolicibacterium senegalense]|nr:hypothetical protein ABW05_01845 [Mycolicibacterium senegalense]